MDKFIKKNINIIIALFVLIGPVIDLLTGISLHVFKVNLTFGIIIRIIFLIFICFITLFTFKKKRVLIPYLIIGIYMILYTVGIILYKDESLFTEIQGLIKVFYFPIILISLYSIRDKLKIGTNMLFYTLCIYVVLIFIPLLLGFGFDTYEITKAGTLGFYNSANEISGIISLLTPIMFIVLVNRKNNIFRLIVLIIYSVVILMMGTKTPLLSLILTIFFSLVYFWIKSIKSKNYKNIFISIGIFIVGCIGLIILIPKTTFYQNIEVHLKFLKVDEVEDVLENEKVFDHFIFSQRLTFLHNRNKDYNKGNIYQKLFGIGYLKKGEEAKLVEMDYFDIFYNHGLIGFIVFFGIFLYVLYHIQKNKVKQSFARYMYSFSLLLAVLLSFFTGHILTSPSVSIIVIMIVLSLYKNNNIGGSYEKRKNILDYALL